MGGSLSMEWPAIPLPRRYPSSHQLPQFFLFVSPFCGLEINYTRHFASDRTCPNHRRTVAASLVQGAYDLESDRRRRRPRDPAPALWERFHFELKRKLIDDADSSIFGAIYEFNTRDNSIQKSSSGDAPRIVVAFRGTKIEDWEDIKLDCLLFSNGLAGTPRFESAMRAVEEMTSAVGGRNLWLAGHSLGASIATLAGKKMAMGGINLETFLFNPPYPPGSVEWIPSKTVKRGIQISSSVLSAGVAFTMEGCRENSRDYFAKLSYLFVNSDDVIKSGYIGYFEHREKMKKIGAGGIVRLATRNTVRVIAFGGRSEPLHRLPSANLAINSLGRNLAAHLDFLDSFFQAHSIRQWSRDLNLLQAREYRY